MKSTTNAPGAPLLILNQVLLDSGEYGYRDQSTGRNYSAIEMRCLKIPFRVEYLRVSP